MIFNEIQYRIIFRLRSLSRPSAAAENSHFFRQSFFPQLGQNSPLRTSFAPQCGQ
jgi:hypothetical protein